MVSIMKRKRQRGVGGVGSKDFSLSFQDLGTLFN